MKTTDLHCNVRFFFAPEVGGDAIKGGGPESLPESDGKEEILDATDGQFRGHRQTPGTNDPGVPGSRTNPVRGDEPKEETDKPAAPITAQGSD
jgi:hypothetical protein